MGMEAQGRGSSGWPYEDEDDVEPPISGATWECPDGSCECHPSEEGEPLELTVLLCDEHARPVPHARCRVLHGGSVINEERPSADGDGWLSVTVRRPLRVVRLEWAPPEMPLSPRYPYRMRYRVDIKPQNDHTAVRRRLQNLGFSQRGVLQENVKDFQRAFGHERITGDVEDIREDLVLFHDRGWIPPIEDGPDDEGEEEERTESEQGSAVPFQAFPGAVTQPKPKPERKAKPKPKAAPVPRPEKAKQHKPAGGLPGSGTARPAPKGKLKLHVCCQFATVDGNGDVDARCRWDEESSNPHPVRKASIELFDMQSQVVDAFVATNGSPATNKLGEVTLKLGALADGQYVLRLNPPPGHELRGAMPGPITDEATREAQLRSVGPGDSFPKDPPEHTRFRLLEIAITLKGGALEGASVVKGMRRPGDVALHGVVVDRKPSLLKIDWKPDWVRCRFVEGVKKEQPDPRDPENGTLSRVHFIVLHHTDAATPGSTINEFTTRKDRNKVGTGAHYLVDVDGHVIKMANEIDHVRHAGPSFWQGVDSSTEAAIKADFSWNDFSVGIEQVHKLGDYPDLQVIASKNVIERIRGAHKTSIHNVLGHGEVAIHDKDGKRLGRKLLCPSETYNWFILENAGSATHPASSVVPHARYAEFFVHNPGGNLNSLGASKASPEVLGLQTTLSEIGYFVSMTGKYDEPTIRAVEAFQVRYFSGRFRSSHQARIMQNRVRLANLITIQKMHDVLASRGRFTF